MTFVETISGQHVDLLHPCQTTIRLEDIAHSLSMQCRFNGHVNRFYSVAQHSLNAWYLAPDEYKAHAILHDAHETYTGDVVTPLKHILRQHLPVIERRLDSAIFSKFGIEWTNDAYAAIKEIDQRLKATEAQHLMNSKSDWMMQYEPYPMEDVPYLDVHMDWQASKLLFTEAANIAIAQNELAFHDKGVYT